jgi:hypothetical protein
MRTAEAHQCLLSRFLDSYTRAQPDFVVQKLARHSVFLAFHDDKAKSLTKLSGGF